MLYPPIVYLLLLFFTSDQKILPNRQKQNCLLLEMMKNSVYSYTTLNAPFRSCLKLLKIPKTWKKRFHSLQNK